MLHPHYCPVPLLPPSLPATPAGSYLTRRPSTLRPQALCTLCSFYLEGLFPITLLKSLFINQSGHRVRQWDLDGPSHLKSQCPLTPYPAAPSSRPRWFFQSIDHLLKYYAMYSLLISNLSLSTRMSAPRRHPQGRSSCVCLN